MTLSESDDIDMRESPGKELRVDNALRILQERVTWSRQRHTSGPTPPAPHSFNSHSTRPAYTYALLSNRNNQFSQTQLSVNIKQKRSGLRVIK